MSKAQADIVQKTLENLNHLEDKIPQAIQGFAELSKAALQAGKFDKRTKEIMALAIAIAVYAKGCIKYHLQSLISQGLTYDELMEVVAIVTYMCGGSGLISATKALKYFEELQHNKSHHGESTSFRDNVTKGYD